VVEVVPVGNLSQDKLEVQVVVEVLDRGLE
jgi:hypothetical protein